MHRSTFEMQDLPQRVRARAQDDRPDIVGVESVILLDWSTSWDVEFERLAAECRSALDGDMLAGIEHIGSTAVPGLVAKPIIDVMIGVRSLAHVAAHWEQPLVGMGFRYIPRHEAVLPMRRYFVRAAQADALGAHLHIVEPESDFWREHLAFRDLLRTHPNLRNEYAAIKRRLAREFRNDRTAYSEAKGRHITRMLRYGAG